MPDARFFDLDSVSCSFAGYPLSGFGEGGSISISYNEDRFTTKVGRLGNVVRSKTNNRTATIEITLLQTSEANQVLSGLAQLDDNTVNGAGVGQFMCRDQINQDEYSAAQCWIKKEPDVEMGAESTDRTWILEAAHLRSFPGGRG